jgi:hypothetical protein
VAGGWWLVAEEDDRPFAQRSASGSLSRYGRERVRVRASADDVGVPYSDHERFENSKWSKTQRIKEEKRKN